MPAPFLLDLTHTSHTRARTGIQRAARSLLAALGDQAQAVTYDPHLRAWRPLETWEKANLTATAPATKRGAQWPLTAKLRGRLRCLGRGNASATIDLPADAPGVIVPEVFSPTVFKALPCLFAATRGPRVALFHDAIALRFPELTPTATVARFPGYLRELLAFDGIAAVSEDSRASLLDYWQWLGVTSAPPVQALPLAIDLQPSAILPQANAPASANNTHPVILSVGSIEGRKNHLALLDACETLWAGGRRFTFHLIGLAHPQTGRAALDRLQALQAAGRPIRYYGPATDSALDAAYAACQFTVYPSLIEGFGLPVLESLAHGKPCICSSRGALGESSRGGGCLALDRLDASSLAAAIGNLLDTPRLLAELSAAARNRHFRSWADYAATLQDWFKDLPSRA